MGKHYTKIQCSMSLAALSIFGAKRKIELTDMRSRVRESLAKTANLILLNLHFFLKHTYLLVKVLSDNLENKSVKF